MTSEQQAAIDELRAKSMPQIQFETCVKWAYRAWGAGFLAQQGLAPWGDQVEYLHEAIEHAALCGVDGAVDMVRRIAANGSP